MRARLISYWLAGASSAASTALAQVPANPPPSSPAAATPAEATAAAPTPAAPTAAVATPPPPSHGPDIEIYGTLYPFTEYTRAGDATAGSAADLDGRFRM